MQNSRHVKMEQKNYEMPPREGFTIAHFLIVTDIERSARFYEKVFDGRILSQGGREKDKDSIQAVPAVGGVAE